MSIIHDENALRFEFGAEWQSIIKLDDHPAYRNGIQHLDGTKSVDFLGLHNNILYLIEVKDFRGHRIENESRLTSGDLAIEFGQKVRDSIACIMGSLRGSNSTELPQLFANKFDKECTVKTVLWLEHDLPNYRKKRIKIRASAETNRFKNKLHWLHSSVLVANLGSNPLPDTTVTNLSRSP